MGRLVKRLPPTPNFHRLKFKLARFQFAFRLRNPEYELVKSALTDFDLSASDWNTGAEQDWVYGDYGDYGNYDDLVLSMS